MKGLSKEIVARSRVGRHRGAPDLGGRGIGAVGDASGGDIWGKKKRKGGRGGEERSARSPGGPLSPFGQVLAHSPACVLRLSQSGARAKG